MRASLVVSLDAASDKSAFYRRLFSPFVEHAIGIADRKNGNREPDSEREDCNRPP